jgi:hypothetical protein
MTDQVNMKYTVVFTARRPSILSLEVIQFLSRSEKKSSRNNDSHAVKRQGIDTFFSDWIFQRIRARCGTTKSCRKQ